MDTRSLPRCIAAALCGAWLAATPVAAQVEQGRTVEWPVYGGSLAAQHYSPLAQIDASNVKNLKMAWRWYAGNYGPNPELKSETTPLMFDGVLYATAGATRNVVAIDAGSGETLWIWRPSEVIAELPLPGVTSAKPMTYMLNGKQYVVVAVGRDTPAELIAFALE